tara:strand:- start:295 stop:798 length:504 start_codon:yes stop_codon:yes gene_type:complete
MPEIISQDTITGNTLSAWQVKEFEHHDRSRRWYVVIGVLGLALFVYGAVTGNFLFSLIIMLFGIILYLQANQTPQQVDVVVCELGLIVGYRFYPWKELKEFYIIYKPPEVKTVFFQPESMYQPKIYLDLAHVDPVALRNVLLEYLEENLEEDAEPASTRFARNWQIH